jgi:hypothetical protein
MLRQPHCLMAIAWPAFLAACLMEFLVFGFWVVTMVCSATTALLMRTPAQVNAQPGPGGPA